jgi:hypothetical protein
MWDIDSRDSSMRFSVRHQHPTITFGSTSIDGDGTTLTVTLT